MDFLLNFYLESDFVDELYENDAKVLFSVLKQSSRIFWPILPINMTDIQEKLGMI